MAGLLLVVVLAGLVIYAVSRQSSRERSTDRKKHRGTFREWPVLLESSNLGELQLLKSRLESENIVVVLEQVDSAGYGTLPIFSHQLRVPPDEFDIARGILRESELGKRLLAMSKTGDQG